MKVTVTAFVASATAKATATPESLALDRALVRAAGLNREYALTKAPSLVQTLRKQRYAALNERAQHASTGCCTCVRLGRRVATMMFF
jgi:hypothetical protein